MGFGLLFCGYITLLFFKVLPPAMAVGAYLMYRGFKRLSIYGKPFVYAGNLAAALGVYDVLFTAIWLGRLFGLFEELLSNRIFVLCDDILYYALLLAFHIALYAALESMAKECGYEKGLKKVRFARVLTAMFYILTAIHMPLSYLTVRSYLPLACLICQLAWYIYTAILLYGFYMRITTDEILEDEEKKLAEYAAKRAGKTRGTPRR